MDDYNRVDARLRGRLVAFPAVDGLSPLQISAIIGQVEEKIKRVEEKTDTGDTAKLATLAAFEFAVELHNLRQKYETNMEADSKKVEDMISKLEKSIEKQ